MKEEIAVDGKTRFPFTSFLWLSSGMSSTAASERKKMKKTMDDFLLLDFLSLIAAVKDIQTQEQRSTHTKEEPVERLFLAIRQLFLSDERRQLRKVSDGIQPSHAHRKGKCGRDWLDRWPKNSSGQLSTVLWRPRNIL